MKLAALVPRPLEPVLRRGWRVVKHIPNLGAARYCPVCRMPARRFEEFGFVARPDARCLYCGALERHRLVWLYLHRMTDLFDGRAKKVLHVAPEAAFRDRLHSLLGDGYLSADLDNPEAMLKMDITDIHFPDESFDVIYCSHVLEHVPDDRRALREFHRVLKADGWAVLLVPIRGERTLEDSSVTDPDDRLRLFGQADHVRQYGVDYVERLEEAGFHVSMRTPDQFLDAATIERMGITEAAGEIFHCTKRPPEAQEPEASR